MRSPRWYAARLRAMGPAEVVWRAVQSARRAARGVALRLAPPRSATDTADANNTARPDGDINSSFIVDISRLSVAVQFPSRIGTVGQAESYHASD